MALPFGGWNVWEEFLVPELRFVYLHESMDPDGADVSERHIQ